MAWRRGLGIGDDEMVVAFLGRIVMEKGLPEFVAAIDALREHKVRHRVLVIGDGPARPWFEQRLPGAVFVGHQEGANLARALASCDVFLNPSITETFGNVTLEAMACGLPVVAAVATGATSLVKGGVTGTLVEAADAEAFGEALAAYARDPDLRRMHGSAGLEFAKTMDWDRINAAVLAVYLRVIARRERYARLTAR
jgi:glycosyltransferase involved in cell wall biosynthesis